MRYTGIKKRLFTREQFDGFVLLGLRWCRDCKAFLEPELFTASKRGNPRCLKCNRERAERHRALRSGEEHQEYLVRLKAWRDHRPGYRKFKRYDVTIEWYSQKKLEQDHSCAICKVHESKFSKDLSIDHNHETGKTRGLLCVRCNSFISGIEDGLLSNSLEYLEKYNGQS